MKALTIWQPYAELVMLGRKLVENRSWPPPKRMVGERIAIHSGMQKCTPPGDVAPDGLAWPVDQPRGVVLGTVVIVEVVPPGKRSNRCPFEHPGAYRWVLGSVERFAAPWPMKGLWNIAVGQGKADR